MFTFGKISTRIYEKRNRENEITHTHTQNEIEKEREQSSLCMRQEEKRIKRLNENSVGF